MARKSVRVDIPKNPDDCIKLAGKVIAKHLKDGAGSPLAGIGMADMAAKNTTADHNNTLSSDLSKQAVKATQARDNALGKGSSTPATVRFYLTAVRDLLLGLNKGNEQSLSDWGFSVTASAGAKAAPPAAKKPGPAA
jgi:hypothetical protein